MAGADARLCGKSLDEFAFVESAVGAFTVGALAGGKVDGITRSDRCGEF